jgi:hypothetical protein
MVRNFQPHHFDGRLTKNGGASARCIWTEPSRASQILSVPCPYEAPPWKRTAAEIRASCALAVSTLMISAVRSSEAIGMGATFARLALVAITLLVAGSSAAEEASR